MKRCIYHTHLGQNAVFHDCSREIALGQYSGRSIMGFWRNCSKHFQYHLYSRLVLTFDKRQTCSASSGRLFEWTLIELPFNIIKNLLRLFFLCHGLTTMCNLEKRLIRAAFWVLLLAMFMNYWKQTAQRLKLQDRLLTINKRSIIRWNISSHKNFHSRSLSVKVSLKILSL